MKTSVCRACDSRDNTLFLEKEKYQYLRCKHCGMVFIDVDEELVLSQNRDIYDSRSKDLLDTGESPEPKSERKHAYILKLLERYKDCGRILDIGCGYGQFLVAAQSRGWRGEGLDIAPDCARFVRERHGIEARAGTLDEAGYPDDHFDVVHMNELLEHIYSPRSILTEIHRVLRPGGAIFLRTRNPDSWSAAFCGVNWRELALLDKEHVCFYSPTTFRTVLPELGFRVESIVTWGCSFQARYSKSQKIRYKLGKLANKAFSPLAFWLARGHRIQVIAEKT